MTKRQLTKAMNDKIGFLSKNLYDSIATMDRAELETCLQVVDGYTNTNCGWIEFNLAPGLRNLIISRLRDISPSKFSKNANNKQ